MVLNQSSIIFFIHKSKYSGYSLELLCRQKHVLGVSTN